MCLKKCLAEQKFSVLFGISAVICLCDIVCVNKQKQPLYAGQCIFLFCTHPNAHEDLLQFHWEITQTFLEN